MPPAWLTRLLLAAALLLAPGATSPASGQGATQQAADIVITQTTWEDRMVNVTLASNLRSLLVESAGLYANGTLISNGTGGMYLQPGVTSTLAFRITRYAPAMDLQASYAYWGSGGNMTYRQVTIPLALPAGPDVRPVDARVEGGDNFTVTLHNFGSSAASGVLVALVNGSGTTVGVPFYRALDPLAAGHDAEADFTLLDSTGDPSVVVEMGGVRRTYPVKPRAEDGAAAFGAVELSTELPSLEGTPGSSVTYTLRVTNRGAQRLVALAVPDLPDSYTATFAVGGSRVQTIQLGAGASRDVALTVAIPTVGNGSAQAPVSLTATVAPADDPSRALDSVALALTVTGAERLELSGRNWFASAGAGVPVEATLTVKNTGTAPAHNVVLSAQPPAGWEVEFEPDRLTRLGPGESADVVLRATSGATTAEGRYVLDVTAQSAASAARERSFSVEVLPPEEPSQLPWLLAAAGAAVGCTALVIYLRRK